MVTCSCHPSYVRRHKYQDHDPCWLGCKVRPYLKNNQHQRAGRVVQVAEHLSSKHTALSSALSATNKEGCFLLPMALCPASLTTCGLHLRHSFSSDYEFVEGSNLHSVLPALSQVRGQACGCCPGTGSAGPQGCSGFSGP
jgi:hypothetical protein